MIDSFIFFRDTFDLWFDFLSAHLSLPYVQAIAGLICVIGCIRLAFYLFDS